MDYGKYRLYRGIADAIVTVHKGVTALGEKVEHCKTKNAIYQPGGAAGEYSKYACSIYVGCPGKCDYCCRDEQPLAGAIGGSVVRLKESLKTESNAIGVYFKELFGGNGGVVRQELLKNGIFFTFTSDPGLPQTFPMVAALIAETVKLHVPVQILTKFTGWMDSEIWQDLQSIPELNQYLAIGFTLTGHDDREPGASPNAKRIAALKRAHKDGFRTFSSIEPIIDEESSYLSVLWCSDFVDLFRVGLLSHGKCDRARLMAFANDLAAIPSKPYIYLKDSLVEQLGRPRESYGANFVNSDFTPFNV